MICISDDVTTLLREIMYEAKNLTTAERCSLFLMDETRQELVAKVFDGPEVRQSKLILNIYVIQSHQHICYSES